MDAEVMEKRVSTSVGERLTRHAAAGPLPWDLFLRGKALANVMMLAYGIIESRMKFMPMVGHEEMPKSDEEFS